MLSKYSFCGSLVRKRTSRNFENLLSVACLSSTPARKPLESRNDAKLFSEIPGPKGLPFLGNVLPFFTANREQGHELITQAFDKYGPIYKEKIGPVEFVILCDVGAVEKVHRLEGKFPRRAIMEAWKKWREDEGHAKGILTSDDADDWKRMRTILDRRMLRLTHVATYTNDFNKVAAEFVNRLRDIRDQKGGGQKVPNLDFELFHWSIESICTVLYEIRLGGLSNQRSPMIAKFIEAAQGVPAATDIIAFFPKSFNQIFFRKAQKLHDDSWNIIFQTTQFLVDEKLKKIKEAQQTIEEPSEITAGLLTYLLSSDMPIEEIYGNVCEMMLAAVDTTSNTVQWTLYQLSRHTAIQKQLQNEIDSVVPIGQMPSNDDLQKMPLLRAVVKEVLRLYPVARFSTRILTTDLELCGYLVPTNTMVFSSAYDLGRNAELFPEPNTFRPERWLRSSAKTDAINPFSWLPFGFGPRMCIGRRIAELEIHLLLVRTFDLIPEDKPLSPITRGMMVPERAVNITFSDRQR